MRHQRKGAGKPAQWPKVKDAGSWVRGGTEKQDPVGWASSAVRGLESDTHP